jgi:hypothetical protein
MFLYHTAQYIIMSQMECFFKLKTVIVESNPVKYHIV